MLTGSTLTGDGIKTNRGGMLTVNPGLAGVVAFDTEIAEPDRDGGALRYRGVDIRSLAGAVSFGDVWGLLADGSFASPLLPVPLVPDSSLLPSEAPVPASWVSPPVSPAAGSAVRVPVGTGDVRVAAQAAAAALGMR